MPDQITLDSAFIKEGVEHVSFWNGRILTGEDLQDEQQANRASRRRLGKAVGPGVASGLMVSPSDAPTRVGVTAGVAVNDEGHALELPVDVEVALVVPAGGGDGGDGVFTVCADAPSDAPPTTGTGGGVYLLTIRPAEGSRDEAAGVPFDGNGVANVCGPRYAVDGVAFRLVAVDTAGLAAAVEHDATDLAILASLASNSPAGRGRNVLAHLFLGTMARRQLVLAPFAASARAGYGLVERLRVDGELDDCDVPLAAVTWGGGQVQIVDSWAVRRPPAPRHAEAGPLEALGSGQAQREGAAAYLQFQQQLGSVPAASRAAFTASSRFRYLPAAGLVPLGPAGFTRNQFFAGLTTRTPVPISAGQVVGLLEASFGYAPVDLTAGEVMYLYRVRGADAPPVADSAGAAPEPGYLVFSSSQLPFLGDELTIDAVFPPGMLHLGQSIEIRGRNFGFSTGAARIFFDAQPANALPGSSDTRLLTTVPSNLAVVEAGTPVTIRVTNNEEDDSVPVLVGLEQVAIDGDIHVTSGTPVPEVLIAGAAAVFPYTIESGLVRTADITLSVVVLPPQSVPPDVTIRNTDGQEIPGGIVNLAPTEATQVFVEVDPIPDADPVTIEARGQAGDVIGEDVDLYTPGVAGPEEDPTITLRINEIRLADGSTGSIEGSTATLATGSSAVFELFADFTAPGTFDVTVAPAELPPGWSTELGDPLDGVIEDIDEADIGGTQHTEAVLFGVTRTADSAAETHIALVVQRRDDPRSTRRTFTVRPQ